jgi:hypothetical protein
VVAKRKLILPIRRLESRYVGIHVIDGYDLPCSCALAREREEAIACSDVQNSQAS